MRNQDHDDHVAIVAALRVHDGDVAAQAMHEHLERMRRVLDGVFGEDERAPRQKEHS
jgi:DNA-binding GntR family transcriptional regulator